MNAHPSPLKCHGYYVTELVLTANPHHKPEKERQTEAPYQ